MRQLAGKCAVVTGAASGIGLGLTKQLASEGMRVVMADVEEPALRDAAAGLRRSGAEVLAVRTDVAKAEDVDHLALAAGERFGPIHVLCNNAGVSRSLGAAWEQSLDDWTWVLGVDLWGPVHAIRAFVPGMLAHGEEGHIVTTASVGGLVAYGRSPAYGAAKSAVITLAESVADALEARGAPIGSTILCPGGVRSRIHSSARNRPPDLADEGPVPPELAAEAAARGSSDRTDLVSPEYIAQLVVQAIRDNQLYLLPMQPHFKQDVRRRLARLDEALSTSPDTGV